MRSVAPGTAGGSSVQRGVVRADGAPLIEVGAGCRKARCAGRVRFAHTAMTPARLPAGWTPGCKVGSHVGLLPTARAFESAAYRVKSVPRGKRERSRAIARVAEETGSLNGDEDAWEPQHEMHALAVFSAHIEYDVGGTWEFEDGPERVALDEALAWGRKRAAKVAVQWYSPHGEIVSSAGELHLEGAPV